MQKTHISTRNQMKMAPAVRPQLSFRQRLIGSALFGIIPTCILIVQHFQG